MPLYHQKEKQTCCLLIYGLWLMVRNILIVEMLKQKVDIRKTFTCETHSFKQYEPACCPSPNLWYWRFLLPSLTCASTVKSSLTSVLVGLLPYLSLFSPISFSYYYLILFLIYTSSNMQKNAKQKGYVFRKSASPLDTHLFLLLQDKYIIATKWPCNFL